MIRSTEQYCVLLGKGRREWCEWRGVAVDDDDAVEKAMNANPGWDAHTIGGDFHGTYPVQNPVLEVFRGWVRRSVGGDRVELAELFLRVVEFRVFDAGNSAAQVEDAVKVLRRFVGVYGG